jgi:S1-C subfamily serine protease
VLAGALIVAGCGDDDRSAGAAAPAVVQVVAGERASREVATGVVVGDGRVLTVAHALDGARSVRVAVPGARLRAARVLARSARLDVAVLAVAGLRAPRVSVRSGRAGQAASLWVLRDGRPLALPATIRRAITARVHPAPGAPARIRPGLELSAAIAKGDSGAPLLDDDGHVLGLAFAAAATDDGVAYAVSAPAATALLR